MSISKTPDPHGVRKLQFQDVLAEGNHHVWRFWLVGVRHAAKSNRNREKRSQREGVWWFRDEDENAAAEGSGG
jgi:hypothetical protein